MTPPVITFNEADHSYTVNGRPAVGVTKALSVIEHWSFIDPDVLQRAADFGRAVHEACEFYDLGDLDEDSLDPALAPYLDGYKQFLAAKKPVWEHIEQRVASAALCCAGTLDRMGLIGKTRWLIDLKSTAATPITVGPQTAAYAEFAKQTLGFKPQKRACLILKPGGFNLVPLNDPADYSLFVSSLNVWRFLEKYHPTKLKERIHAAA